MQLLKRERKANMNSHLASVMLEFPCMPTPYRVNVSFRQLAFLDRNAERRFAEDGTVIYTLPHRAFFDLYPTVGRRYSIPEHTA
jgi:hypothetical protein